MSLADKRRVRAEVAWWCAHVGFWCVAVALEVLELAGRLTRWAAREGWYRPHISLAVAMSTLPAYWIGPTAGAATFAAMMLGRGAWLVRRFGRACGASSARALVPILFTLSRQHVRAARLRRRWRKLAAPVLRLGHGLTGEPPRLRAFEYPSPVRVTAVANVSATGRHIDDWLTPRMGDLRQLLGKPLHSVTVTEVRGHAGLARFSFRYGSPLEEVQPITALPDPLPGWAFFGLGADGEPAGVRLDLSTLFTGESRSGKSTSMWCYILSALEQWYRAGGDPVEFWVIDLALTEFHDIQPLTADLRPQFNSLDPERGLKGHRYATTQAQACQLLRLAMEEADRRARILTDKHQKKLHPSEDLPRIVIVVDEALRLVESRGDASIQRLGTEATMRLRQILTQHSKFGVSVIAGTQASKIEVLTHIRDWFQQRVAFSTATKEMTDTALGQGAAAAGANCHQLSPYWDAGRGFMHRDGHSGFFEMRGIYLTDDDTAVIGRGEIPDRLLARRGEKTSKEKTPGAVYVIWGAPDPAGHPDAEGVARRCLYVGMTVELDPADRWLDHLGGATREAGTRKKWADKVERIDVIAEDEDTGMPLTKRDAELLERRLVRLYNPSENDIRYLIETEYERELIALGGKMHR